MPLRAVVLVLLLANAGLLAGRLGWLAPLWRAPEDAQREPARLQSQVQPQRLRVLPAVAAAGPTGPGAAARPTAGPEIAPGAAGTATAGGTGREGSIGAGVSPPGSAGPPAAGTAAAGPAGPPSAPGPDRAAGLAAAALPSTGPPAGGTVCLASLPLPAADAAAGSAALAAVGVAPGRWQRVSASAVQAPWLVYAGPFADATARRTVLAQWRRLGLAVETVDVPAELAPGLLLSRHDGRAAAEVARSALPEAVAPLVRVVAVGGGAPAQILRIPAADAPLLAQLRLLAPPWATAFRPCADGVR